MLVRALALLLSSCLAAVAAAQGPTVDRYELGLRLRAFERELESTTDAARRKAAFAELDSAVKAFFGLDFPGVAHAVLRAHAALRGEPPTAATAFAARAWLFAGRRLVDPDVGPVLLELRELPLPRGRDDDEVDEEGAAPLPGTAIVVLAPDGERELLRADVVERPQRLSLPIDGLPDGDHSFPFRLVRGDDVLVRRELHLSLARGCDRRLAALAEPQRERDDLEGRTQKALVRMLGTTLRERREETVLPAERLLRDAEALAALPTSARYYDDARAGQHWLAVPTAAGTASIRLVVPTKPTPGARPLVFALHGAGGSENLFCDGYGDGAIVRLCEQRGWVLCAPRASGMTGVDLPALLDALATRCAIDRDRVFVVGHSMGAMQASAQACRSPATFAAVAALGGGGSVRRSEELTKLPFLVAAGSRDFGRNGARSLDEALRRAGAPSSYRDYADVEHLAIVQVALPDVFAFFDAAAKGSGDGR